MAGRGVGPLFVDLVTLSIKDPRAAIRQVIDLNPAISIVLQAAFLTAVVSVLMVEGSIYFSDPETQPEFPFELPSIPLHLLGQFVGVVVMGWLSFVVAKLFKGTGSFRDSLIVVVWLNIVILALQILATVVGLILPFVGSLILLAAILLLFYMFIKFMMEVHGFTNEFLVLASMVSTLFLTAFVLSFVLVLFGFTPEIALPPVEPS